MRRALDTSNDRRVSRHLKRFTVCESVVFHHRRRQNNVPNEICIHSRFEINITRGNALYDLLNLSNCMCLRLAWYQTSLDFRSR